MFLLLLVVSRGGGFQPAGRVARYSGLGQMLALRNRIGLDLRRWRLSRRMDQIKLQEKVDATNKAPKKTPLATASKGIDDYERDTDVSEELSSEKLMQLLLPDGCFPGSNSNKSNFFIACQTMHYLLG